MRKKNRRSFTAEFKARVALGAARGARTINEIAAEDGLHTVQVGQWKKELLEGAAVLNSARPFQLPRGLIPNQRNLWTIG